MYTYTHYYHVVTLRIKPKLQAYMSFGLLFRVRERETVKHVVLVSLTQNEGFKPENNNKQ